MSSLTLNDLRRARRAREDSLAALPGVVGTGLGVKRRAGELVANTALMVFVDRKLPDVDLHPKARIPAFVTSGRRRIPTDVVQVNAIRPEFGSAPYFMWDAVERGVVSAFGAADGEAVLVTCAHCLVGPDKNPYSASPVGVWAGLDAGYIEVGETVYSISSPGFGRPGDFGFMDAGFARIRHSQLLRRARAAQPMEIAQRVRVPQQVVADGPNGPVTGKIEGVEIELYGQRTDVLVRVDRPGTYPGYSGMMWRARDGSCVAMHSFGAQFTPSGGSGFSLAVMTRRVEKELQISLLQPV